MDYEKEFFETMLERMKSLETKVDDLMAFKLKLIGGGVILSLIMSITVGLVIKYL